MDFLATFLLPGLCYSLMGFGIFISMKIFKIPDITTDGSFTLGAALTAVLLTQYGWHPVSIFFLTFLGGAIAGVCTALIHHYIRIDALLSGILVMTALYSINLIIMGRSNIPLASDSSIASVLPWGETTNEWIVICASVALMWGMLHFLFRTDLGLGLRATGENENMSRANGIPVGRMKITGLAIANGLTALSGSLLAQLYQFADINMGIGIVITGLGSVLIADSLALLAGARSIWARAGMVILGSILFQLILALSLRWGMDPNYLKLITAALVLICVMIPGIRKKQ